MAETISPYMTPEEVADYLRIKTRTVYEYLSRGEFPHHKKVCRSYRIPKSDVLELLNKYSDSPRLNGRRIISPGVSQ
jgi:excisionase family DNA binding protein